MLVPGPPSTRALIPALLQYHLLVVLLAFTAVLGRIVTIEAASLVLWRTGIAALAMAAVLLLTARDRLRLPGRLVLPVLGVGVLQGAHWICFFWSIKLANVSVALAAFATTSLFTALTEPLLERRRVRPSEIISGAIVLAGMLLITGRLGGDLRAGFMVGIVGALLHAIFPVLNRGLVAGGQYSRTLLLYEMTGASLLAAAAIPFFPPAHLQFPASADWLPLLTLALLCTVIAHTWNIHLLRHLTAYTANLAMNFEPVWGILFGAIFFLEYEDLRPGFYLGAALILVANFLDPWLRKKRKYPPSSD